jgi:hypothetical protein
LREDLHETTRYLLHALDVEEVEEGEVAWVVKNLMDLADVIHGSVKE